MDRIIYLEKAPVVRVDGEVAHIEIFSGKKTFHFAAPVSVLQAGVRNANRALDGWAERKPGEVVPFKGRGCGRD